MIPPASIGAMSSSRVILGELPSGRARLRFPGQPQPATSTPVRHHKYSERHTGTSCTVSLQGVTPGIRDLRALSAWWRLRGNLRMGPLTAQRCEGNSATTNELNSLQRSRRERLGAVLRAALCQFCR